MKYIHSKTITFLSNRFRIDARYFFIGGIWLSIIQVITVAGALTVSAVLANEMSESSYGIYRYIIGLGALLTSFSLTGMGQSIFQTAAKGYRGFYRIGNAKSLIYSIGVTLSALLASLYYYYQHNTDIALGCLLIAIFQPLLNTFQQIFPFLQGEKRFRESTILQGIKTLIVTTSSIATIYFTQDVLWLIFIYLLSNTITNFSVHLFYQPKHAIDTDSKIEKRYMEYARSISIQNIIAGIAFRVDSIIVFQQLGAVNLAIYTIANIIPENIKNSFKNIITLLVPNYAKHENLESIKRSMPKRSMQLLGVFLLITFVYIVCAPYIYKILFPKYEEAILLSQLIALSFPAMIALIPLSALQAHTHKKELQFINTQGSLLMIAATIFLTITFGLNGAVLARVISRYINLCITYFYFFRTKS